MLDLFQSKEASEPEDESAFRTINGTPIPDESYEIGVSSNDVGCNIPQMPLTFQCFRNARVCSQGRVLLGLRGEVVHARGCFDICGILSCPSLEIWPLPVGAKQWS